MPPAAWQICGATTPRIVSGRRCLPKFTDCQRCTDVMPHFAALLAVVHVSEAVEPARCQAFQCMRPQRLRSADEPMLSLAHGVQIVVPGEQIMARHCHSMSVLRQYLLVHGGIHRGEGQQPLLLSDTMVWPADGHAIHLSAQLGANWSWQLLGFVPDLPSLLWHCQAYHHGVDHARS